MANELKTVLFLQNAWSPFYAGREWPRESWLKALRLSRSGQRLKVLIGAKFEQCENTTPIVGDSPDSVIPPDEAHINAILWEKNPDIVVTCGKQAEIALSRLWRGNILAIPHPAHRLLTDSLLLQAKGLLLQPYNSRMALRQKRGYVLIERLAP